MAQGLGMEVKEEPRVIEADEKKISGSLVRKNVEGRVMGSRRIFAPHFKLKVLDSYRQDADCRGNQRATARKYGIHRRQIQKWLQVETYLRTSVEVGPSPAVASPEQAALNLCTAAEAGRQLDARAGESQQAICQLGGAASSGEESIEASLFPSTRLHDCASGDQDSNSEVTVSLFPSVKIEAIIKKESKLKSPSPLSIQTIQPLKEESNFDPFSSVKFQESSHHNEDYPIKDEPESDEESNMTPLEQDQALDFTCAALSKRRSFSLQFKLEVLDAFHSDDQCIGNQRATARKFGINRRQVQKWLHQELDLRGETVSRGGLYRQRLGRWSETDEMGACLVENQETNCALDLIKQKIDVVTWDVPNRKRKSVPLNVIPFKKRTVELLLKQQNKDNVIDDVTSSAENVLPEVQETALCLVKAKRPPREYTMEETSSDRNSNVSSSADLNRVIGQALYHSNREHLVPPYMNLPLPTHLAGCYPPEHIPFHHMLSFYRGFIADHNVRENIYPLDFKLKALDCYHGEGFCRGNQYAVASRFGIGQDQIQKWLKQEDQLRQYSDTSRMINIFR